MALNTITGLDVNESKLGTVPSAARADSAGIGLSPVPSPESTRAVTSASPTARSWATATSRAPAAGGTASRACPFAFRSAQVTIDYADAGAGDTAQVATGNPKGDCPGGNRLEVVTSNGAGRFYVWFFGYQAAAATFGRRRGRLAGSTISLRKAPV